MSIHVLFPVPSPQATVAALQLHFTTAPRLVCVGDTVSVLVPPCTAEEGILQNLHSMQGTAVSSEREGLGYHSSCAAQGSLFYFRVAELKPDAETALAVGDATEMNIMVR